MQLCVALFLIARASGFLVVPGPVVPGPVAIAQGRYEWVLRATAPEPAPRRVGRLRRAWRWLRGTRVEAVAAALTTDEVLGLVVLGYSREAAEAMAAPEARSLLSASGAAEAAASGLPAPEPSPAVACRSWAAK